MVNSSATPPGRIALKQKLYPVKWELDDSATPALVDALIDDTFDDLLPDERASLKSYLLVRTKARWEYAPLTMGGVDGLTSPFIEGYRVGEGRTTPEKAGRE